MIQLKITCSSIIEKDGKYLLVRETKKEAEGKWNFPGGTLERNEEIIHCAIRETKEETGLQIKIDRVIGVYQRPTAPDGNNLVFFVFKSTIKSGIPRISKEHPQVGYFSYEEIKKLESKRLLRMKYIMPALDKCRAKRFIDISAINIY